MSKRKIIIDTDPGIDDTFAITTAMNYDGFDLLGLTVVAGNVGLEPCVENALGIVKFMEADCFVYKGAHASLFQMKNKATYEIDSSVHGKRGLGEVELAFDERQLSTQNAVDFILETVQAYPDEVELITLGPLTNIALAIQKDPVTMKRVKHIWSMGGGIAQGNVTPYAEFNYWADPDAAKIVYDFGQDISIHMVGLDVTHGTRFTLEDLFFLEYECGELGAMYGKMADHYKKIYWESMQMTGVIIHDLVAVMLAIDPTLSDGHGKIVNKAIDIVCDGEEKGRTIEVDQPTNAIVYMDIDAIRMKETFMKICFPEKYELYETLILQK